MSQPGIIIIGAGEAGVAAAHELRSQEYAGSVTLISDEASLPYERPPLSKEMLVDDDPQIKLIRASEWYTKNAVDLRLSTRVTEIDASAKLVRMLGPSGLDIMSYEKLLLATGSTARRFDTDADILYLRSHEDSANLYARIRSAQSVAIIGGGVIGLEVASSAAALGKKVTVYELAERLMGRSLSACVSEWLAALHAKAGVEIVVDATVEVMDDGVWIAGKPIRDDLVVAGIGAEPRIDLARQTGCKIDGGVIVNGRCETSVPNIYAAGDAAVIRLPGRSESVRIETWRHAQNHAAHAARAMMGAKEDYLELPWFWTDQHGANVQVTGFCAGCDQSFWRSDPDKDQHTILHFDGPRLVAATTINNGRDMRPATKLIKAGWKGPPNSLLDTGVAFRAAAASALSVDA